MTLIRENPPIPASVKIKFILRLLFFFILIFPLLLIFILIWCCTLIGPLLHQYWLQQEQKFIKKELLKLKEIKSFQSPSLGINLVYRWTVSTNNKKTIPVCLPGGLGSTMAMMGVFHDRLVREGYNTLSYDRAGVGFSDKHHTTTPSKNGATLQLETPDQIVNDMAALMNYLAPNQKFILVGGSYGNTISELFVARYPHQVCGIVNLDGLPHTLNFGRTGFENAAKIYKWEAMMSKLGVLRPMISLLSCCTSLPSMFANSYIQWPIIRAQIQHHSFFTTIEIDMPRMMDVCQVTEDFWGEVSPVRWNEQLKSLVLNMIPDVTIIDNVRTVASLSSNNNAINNEAKQRIKDLIKNCRTSSFPQNWSQLVVRSLSCRNYNYDPFEQFMKSEVKDHYVLEHSLLTLAARDGKRWVYPNLTHGDVFKLIEDVILATHEVYNGCEVSIVVSG
jgi:pimeloyl-ACP methyl ester carboxylesterase